jgi:exonuclease III
LLNLWTIKFPHILCLTEHYLHDHEINSTYVKCYTLGAKYCGKSHKYGAVSIFVREGLLFSTVKLDGFCRDQDLEVCAVKLHISSFVFCILCVYRPYLKFFIIHKFFRVHSQPTIHNSIDIIICGDININYLDNTNSKLQLDSLLLL